MKLIVFSHKESWKSTSSPSSWATDGGFAIHMDYLSSIFEQMTIWVPEVHARPEGEVPYTNVKIQIAPILFKFKKGKVRKIRVLMWAILNAPRLIRAVQKHDAVHVPIPSDIGTIGIWLALIFKKSLYVRYCGNILNLKTNAERYWGRLLVRIAGGKNVVLATGGGQEFPMSKNPNIHWIFSSSLTKKTLLEYGRPRRKPSINNGNLKIGYLGRVEEGKGIELLLQSLPSILYELPEWRVQIEIAGDGSYRKELEQQFSFNGIVFRGKLNRDDVRLFLQEIDVFVFPSFSEGFPKVVLEAMASGLPVICSNVSVLPKLVGASGSGIILEDLSSKAISSAVIRLLSEDGLYDQLSQNSIEEASKYSLEAWVEAIESHLRKGWDWK